MDIDDAVTLKDIQIARENLGEIVYRTILAHNTTLSEMCDSQIYLKTENLQKTGSFKIRGAFNKISRLTDEEKARGVIAASAGDHAQGVALAATTHNIKSTIVMPRHAPLSKVTATKNYGADIVLCGEIFDEAYRRARELQEETGATFVHPFDDPHIIAGQGTIGLEILEDLPEAEVIVVPVGGGGLIAGIATAVKNLKPQVKIIGVQTESVPSVAKSLETGKIQAVSELPTIADGIAVKTPGDITFEIIKRYVDDVVTVGEDEIANAILILLERAKLTSEGAGAAAVAAVLHRLSHLRGKKIAALISGGNIDVNILARIIDRGLLKSGRKVFLNTIIPDRPGTLSQLLKIVADTGANVLSVAHHRTAHEVALGQAKVKLQLETRDEEHIAEIKAMLNKENYGVN